MYFGEGRTSFAYILEGDGQPCYVLWRGTDNLDIYFGGGTDNLNIYFRGDENLCFYQILLLSLK